MLSKTRNHSSISCLTLLLINHFSGSDKQHSIFYGTNIIPLQQFCLQETTHLLYIEVVFMKYNIEMSFIFHLLTELVQQKSIVITSYYKKSCHVIKKKTLPCYQGEKYFSIYHSIKNKKFGLMKKSQKIYISHIFLT